MTPEIVKIKIKMGTIEVEMSLEEAKELQRVLDNAFGSRGVWYPWIDTCYPKPYWKITTSGSTLYVEQKEKIQ